MKKIIAIAVIAAIIIFMIFRLVSNRDKNLAKNVVDINVEQVAVSVVPAKKVNFDKSFRLVGNLKAEHEVDVASETSGKVTEIHCEVGDYKSKGSILVSVDDELRMLAFQSAKINYEKMQKDMGRYENLYQGGTITEQQYDDLKTALENARIQFEQAETQLSYTKITAPINGIVTRRLVEVGTFVGMGSMIASIVDPSLLKVELSVSENIVYELKTGQEVTITTTIYPDVEFKGRVKFVSPKGDAFHNYPVEISLRNDSKNPLKAGTFVNVLVDAPSTEGLSIPRECLLGSIKDASVYVVENNVAKLRSIVIGRETNENIEVISGLSEGESVVFSGQVNLSDNRSVKIF
jgi:RND family efflux transporter MFP subunit